MQPNHWASSILGLQRFICVVAWIVCSWPGPLCFCMSWQLSAKIQDVCILGNLSFVLWTYVEMSILSCCAQYLNQFIWTQFSSRISSSNLVFFSWCDSALLGQIMYMWTAALQPLQHLHQDKLRLAVFLLTGIMMLIKFNIAALWLKININPAMLNMSNLGQYRLLALRSFPFLLKCKKLELHLMNAVVLQ